MKTCNVPDLFIYFFSSKFSSGLIFYLLEEISSLYTFQEITPLVLGFSYFRPLYIVPEVIETVNFFFSLLSLVLHFKYKFIALFLRLLVFFSAEPTLSLAHLMDLQLYISCLFSFSYSFWFFLRVCIFLSVRFDVFTLHLNIFTIAVLKSWPANSIISIILGPVLLTHFSLFIRHIFPVIFMLLFCFCWLLDIVHKMLRVWMFLTFDCGSLFWQAA